MPRQVPVTPKARKMAALPRGTSGSAPSRAPRPGPVSSKGRPVNYTPTSKAGGKWTDSTGKAVGFSSTEDGRIKQLPASGTRNRGATTAARAAYKKRSR